MLSDIAGGTKTVDHVAILIIGSDLEPLLAVPKIGRGTGQEQCDACVCSLEKRKLKLLVSRLVFDTTASNTGLKTGACMLIEKALGKQIISIACRHHVFEIMLSDVFAVSLGCTSGPVVGLFKRFKNAWHSIKANEFRPASADLFAGMPDTLREEVTLFYANVIQGQFPRQDYKELLQLCHLFLGGLGVQQYCVGAPGAMHVRWRKR